MFALSSLAGLLAVVPLVYSTGNSCCDRLRAKTSGSKVLGPVSLGYPIENSAYWSSTCSLAPQCIFTPTSASDVSVAIKALTVANCEFAIRGGGHTPNPGWAGTSNGVLISLSKLKTIQDSQDSTSVLVGAGNR